MSAEVSMVQQNEGNTYDYYLVISSFKNSK